MLCGLSSHRQLFKAWSSPGRSTKKEERITVLASTGKIRMVSRDLEITPFLQAFRAPSSHAPKEELLAVLNSGKLRSTFSRVLLAQSVSGWIRTLLLCYYT